MAFDRFARKAITVMSLAGAGYGFFQTGINEKLAGIPLEKWGYTTPSQKWTVTGINTVAWGVAAGLAGVLAFRVRNILFGAPVDTARSAQMKQRAAAYNDLSDVGKKPEADTPPTPKKNAPTTDLIKTQFAHNAHTIDVDFEVIDDKKPSTSGPRTPGDRHLPRL